MAKPSKNSIAVITTGGTIASAFAGDVTALDSDAAGLKQQFQAISDTGGFPFRVFSPLQMLSENMGPADWGTILHHTDLCLKAGFKRIIVTHGTDTLPYSAFAASLYFGDSDARICFTGAFYPPSHPNSDAGANIEAAMHFVSSRKVSPGVYVAFRQAGHEVALIRAMDVMPMTPDKTYFEGMYGRTAGSFDAEAQEVSFTPSEEPELRAGLPIPKPAQLANPGCRIFRETCHPELRLTEKLRLDALQDTVIVLDAYHSGTLSKGLGEDLVTLQRTYPRTRVVAMHPGRVAFPYETTAAFADAGALSFYRDLQPHQIETAVRCITSSGRSLDQALLKLEPWRFRPSSIPPAAAPVSQANCG